MVKYKMVKSGNDLNKGIKVIIENVKTVIDCELDGKKNIRINVPLKYKGYKSKLVIMEKDE